MKQGQERSLGYAIGRAIGSLGPSRLLVVSVALIAASAVALNWAAGRQKQVDLAIATAKAEEDRAQREAQQLAIEKRCRAGEAATLKEAQALLLSGDTDGAVRHLEFCEGSFQSEAGAHLLDKARKANQARLDRIEAEARRNLALYAKAEKAKKRGDGVTIGMSQQDVLDSSWGKPQSVNRTTNAYGTHEQWVYGGRNYLYFDNGVLTSIQN